MSPADLVGRRVVVEVPATIANLGAGYDCLGLAIDLRLRVELSVEAGEASRASGPAVRLQVDGEGRGEIPDGRSNRFVAALEAGLEAGHEAGMPGHAEAGWRGATAVADGELAWRIRMANDIPLARGLGSSGAATVAGLLAAEALAGAASGGTAPGDATANVAPAGLLGIATRLEGHPDNVAPALLGGLVASMLDGGRVVAHRLEPPRELRIALFVPDRRSRTAEMRALLPDAVPRLDAVATLGRAVTAMAGLSTGDWGALRLLDGDRLHEPYRTAAYRELPVLTGAAREAGALAAFLAGSGSAVAAVTLEPGRVGAIAAAMAGAATGLGLVGAARVVEARRAGGRIVEVGPARGSAGS